MPDVSNELEALAEQFSSKVKQSTDELVTGLHSAMADMTQEERMIFLNGAPVDELMEAKMSSAMVIYEEGVRRTLETTFTSSALSEPVLNSVLNQAKNKINADVIKHLSNDVTDKLINGMATGKFPNEIIKDLDLAMPKHQVTTLVNTSYNQFGNSVTNLLAENLPDSTKFIYIGPFDEKTRDECRERIEKSPMTLKEIRSEYGGLDNLLWNCRHKWEEMSDEPNKQGLASEEDISLSAE